MKSIKTFLLALVLAVAASLASAQLLPEEKAQVEQQIRRLGIDNRAIVSAMERMGYRFDDDPDRRRWPAVKLLAAGYLEAGEQGQDFIKAIAHGLAREHDALRFEPALSAYFEEFDVDAAIPERAPPRLEFRQQRAVTATNEERLPQQIRDAIVALSPYIAASGYRRGSFALALRIRPDIGEREAFRILLRSPTDGDFALGVIESGTPPPTQKEKTRNLGGVVGEVEAARRAPARETFRLLLAQWEQPSPPPGFEEPILDVRSGDSVRRHDVDLSPVLAAARNGTDIWAAAEKMPLPRDEKRAKPVPLPPKDKKGSSESPSEEKLLSSEVPLVPDPPYRRKQQRPLAEAMKRYGLIVEHLHESTGPRISYPTMRAASARRGGGGGGGRGIIFGAEITSAPGLRAQQVLVVAIKQPSAAPRFAGTHRLVFKLADGRTVYSRPFGVDVLVGAHGLIFDEASGFVEGDGLMLVSLLSDGAEGIAAPEFAVHPAVETLELGRQLVAADSIPFLADFSLVSRAESIEHPDAPCVQAWLHGRSTDQVSYRFSDVAADIRVTGDAIYPMARRGPGISTAPRDRFLSFLEYLPLIGIADGEAVDVSGKVPFHACVPFLTTVSPEFRAANDLAQAVALLRWAKRTSAKWGGGLPAHDELPAIRAVEFRGGFLGMFRGGSMTLYADSYRDRRLSQAYTNYIDGERAAAGTFSPPEARVYNAWLYRRDLVCVAIQKATTFGAGNVVPAQKRLLSALVAAESAATETVDEIEAVWTDSCVARLGDVREQLKSLASKLVP